MTPEGSSSQFSFDEVVGYLRGLVGQHVRVHAVASNRGQTGAHFNGELTGVLSAPFGYVCQIGDQGGNGFVEFVVSPYDFRAAAIEELDPESGSALRIYFLDTDFNIRIEDDRLTGTGPLPGAAAQD
jgi:hypothetical protein